MRTIELPLSEVLDLVTCAETYGFEDDVLFCAFADWVSDLSTAELDAEVEEWVRSAFLSEEAAKRRFTEEDAENARERIAEWRKKYVDRSKGSDDASADDSSISD